MLKEGTKAPAFTLDDQGGNSVSLSDFEGQKVLLWFYPKAVHLAERLKVRNSGMSFKIFRIKILSFLV